MAHVVGVVVQFVGEFVRTLWGLQERRWSSTFDAVSSATISITMTLVLCFFSVSHTRRRTAMVFSSF